MTSTAPTPRPLTAWDDLVENVQRAPLSILSALMPRFGVNAACCGKRKGAGWNVAPWSVSSFPSEDSFGDQVEQLRKKSSRDNSENEMPLYHVTAIAVVPHNEFAQKPSTPTRGTCGQCRKPISQNRAVYLAYDVQFCSERCRFKGMDKYSKV